MFWRRAGRLLVMRLEHTGLQVPDPIAMGEWYVKHLGFVVKRAADTPVPVRFLADQTGRVMIEIYNNPTAPMPNYAAADPLLFHLAFVCEDIAGTIARLTAAGATVADGPVVTPAGDELAMLRDPWQVPIQLCKRGKAMVI